MSNVEQLTRAPLNWGGVMRCCISALKHEPPRPVKGDVMRCQYCTDGFRFDGEEWVGINAPDGYRGMREVRNAQTE